jgi:WD40 repeat protein
MTLIDTCHPSDCLRCLDDTRVVSKSMDNRVVLWDWCAQSVERELRVKGKSEAGGARTLFDISSDGQYLAVGSKSGAVYHYELATGECIHALEHKRARQSVRACAFSAHCKHVPVGDRGIHLALGPLGPQDPQRGGPRSPLAARCRSDRSDHHGCGCDNLRGECG